MQTYILVFLIFIGGASASDLPQCPDPSYNNDISKIVVESLDALKPYMVTGIPSLGIPPLDPLQFFTVMPFGISNEYIVLDGTINDTVIYNLSKFETCEMTLEFGIKQKFAMDLRTENFHVEGFYDIDGVYVSIFPIFGQGNYTLDVYNASIYGAATVNYNVIKDQLSIKNLELDVRFDQLELFMECILGCGDMADIVNNFLGELATAIFESIWNFSKPIVEDSMENVINNILSDIGIRN